MSGTKAGLIAPRALLKSLLAVGALLGTSGIWAADTDLHPAVGRIFVDPPVIRPEANGVIRFSIAVEGLPEPGFGAYGLTVAFAGAEIDLVDGQVVSTSSEPTKISCSAVLNPGPATVQDPGILLLDSGQGNLVVDSQGTGDIQCVQNGLTGGVPTYACGVAGTADVVTPQIGSGGLIDFVCLKGSRVPGGTRVTVTPGLFPGEIGGVFLSGSGQPAIDSFEAGEIVIDVQDADNDGIPDEIELAWGLDPLNPADGAADSDYDGTTNREEHEAGTDPFYPDGDAGLHADSLIYVPVISCRIVNTRDSIDGPLRPDVARNFLAWGTAAELAAQGGRDDCPHPKQAEGLRPVAIAANVTAVGKQASGNGNVVAYPAGDSDPGSSLVNFTTAANIANATTIKLCDPASCAADGVDDGDFALKASFSTVPAIVDVQGYYYAKELHNFVTVATAGGDYGSPLAALGALRKLVDDNDAARPSAANPYVVLLGPGAYTLGTRPLRLLPGVTLRGAGQGVTVLRGLGSAGGDQGVVQGADDAVLRELSVEAAGDGASYAIAVLNDNASPRLARVALSASGAATNLAVLNRNGAQVQLKRVEARATGGSDSTALRNESAAGAALNRITLGATGATAFNDAIDNGAGCMLEARNSLLDGDVLNDNTASPVVLRASQLIGSPGGAGSFACMGVFDADFAPLDGACQADP